VTWRVYLELKAKAASGENVMHSNDAQLVRVYPRRMGDTIADVAFPSDCALEIVVECKAETAVYAIGAKYEIRIDVIDFSAMTSVIAPVIVATGHLGDAGWPTQAQQIVFPIAAPGTASKGHVWKSIASLKIGITNPHTSLAESELFLITSP
jgi:hypothetical protein